MEIKDNRIEISKGSWVYKLLNWTGMTKWDEPKETCTLFLMLGWRLALATVLTLNFIVGWIHTFCCMSLDDGFMIAVVIIAWLELVVLFFFSLAIVCAYIEKRFKECKKSCPRVSWTEEK